MSAPITRPEIVRNEHLTYLDELRKSGDTNMLGARPYLIREFPELTGDEAGAVLSYWMKSFGEASR